MLKRPDMSMSKTELKQMAEKIGLPNNGTKEQLIEAIDSELYDCVHAEPLLYIYGCKSKTRCPDESKIQKLADLFKRSQKGLGNYDAKKNYEFRTTNNRYMGHHVCSCGERSSSCDYLLPGNKYFTNSLCVHYLECHYDDINKTELAKLDNLLK